jgi:hypothetical protein
MDLADGCVLHFQGSSDIKKGKSIGLVFWEHLAFGIGHLLPHRH